MINDLGIFPGCVLIFSSTESYGYWPEFWDGERFQLAVILHLLRSSGGGYHAWSACVHNNIVDLEFYDVKGPGGLAQ